MHLGIDVVADSCNPISLTRHAWEAVAQDANAHFKNIQIICSDASEHRTRVETRPPDIPNLKLPSWCDVMQRDYQPWDSPCIVIDTAQTTVEASFQALWSNLSLTLS